MNHQDLDRDMVYDRYVMDTLTDEERVGFEAHFLDCQRCLDELDVSERWLRGWHNAAGAIERPILPQTAPASWPVPLAAGIAALAVAVAGWSYHSAQRAQNHLAKIQNQTAGPGVAASTGPAGNIPVLLLSAVRGPATANPPAQRVAPDPGAPHYLLALETTGYGAGRFRARIDDSAGRTRWTGSDLVENQMGWLVVTIPSTWLDPGEFQFVLNHPDSAPGAAPLARFPFAVLPAATD